MSTTDRPVRFRISLRMLLLALVGAGVGTGLLGRLFTRNPDAFRAIVGLLATAVPGLLAIGTIIVLGVRKRHLRLVIWGVSLLLMPIVFGLLLAASVRYAGSSPGGLGVLSTEQLIKRRLPTEVDTPWVWDELERRLQAGSLTPEEVNNAVGVLISHMKFVRPKGWDQPFSWQKEFLAAANKSGLLSQETIMDLCDAYFGVEPVIRPLPRLREGNQGFTFRIKYGNTWVNQSGLDTVLVWEVKRVLINGQPMEVKRDYQHHTDWSGRYEQTLPVGNHNVTVECECAYVDQSKMIGLPSDAPSSQWPATLKRWTRTVSAPIQVFSSTDSIVTLNKEPSRAPKGVLSASRLVVQTDRDGGKKVILEINYSSKTSIPLSCEVEVIIAGQRYSLGHTWIVTNGSSSEYGSTSLEQKIEGLDPAIRIADILLTPAPAYIEHRSDVSEIWGQPITLSNIPIERLDLESAPTTERHATP